MKKETKYRRFLIYRAEDCFVRGAFVGFAIANVFYQILKAVFA